MANLFVVVEGREREGIVEFFGLYSLIQMSCIICLARVTHSTFHCFVMVRLQTEPAGRVRHLSGYPWVVLKYLWGPDP